MSAVTDEQRDDEIDSTEDRIRGVGGEELYVRTWSGGGTPRAVVLIVHGLGEHSGRYQHVAERLVGAGYAVAAYDHRGHGRSSGTRAHVDRYADFIDDLDLVRRHVVARHPDLPLFLLGHSMGGNIALGYALDHQQHLAGLILSGPAVRVPDSVPGLVVGVSKVVARVAPRARVMALDATKVSRDPEVVAAYQADPLVHHGKVTAGLGVALLTSMASFPERVADLTVPTLVMHGTADELADVEGSQMLEAGVGSDDLTVNYYEGLAHEIFNEPEQDEVLDAVVAWLDERR